LIRSAILQEVSRFAANAAAALTTTLAMKTADLMWIAAAVAIVLSVGQFPGWTRVRVLGWVFYRKRFGRRLAERFVAGKQLRVGVVDYIPLAITAENEVHGVFPDLLKELLSEGALPQAKWEVGHSLAGLLEKIENGELDLLLPIFDTPERHEKDTVEYVPGAKIKVRVGGLVLDPDGIAEQHDQGKKAVAQQILEASRNGGKPWEKIATMDNVRFIVNAREAGEEFLRARIGARDFARRLRRHEASNLFSGMGDLLVGEGNIIVCDAITLSEIKARAKERKYKLLPIGWNQPLAKFECTIAISKRVDPRFRKWFEQRWTAKQWRVTRDKEVIRLFDEGAIEIAGR